MEYNMYKAFINTSSKYQALPPQVVAIVLEAKPDRLFSKDHDFYQASFHDFTINDIEVRKRDETIRHE